MSIDKDPGVLSLAKRLEMSRLKDENARLRVELASRVQALDATGAHYCRNAGVLLDETSRTATCRGCQKTRDLFDVLLEYAHHERNFAFAQKDKQNEIKRLAVELVELKKERANLRAAIRRGKASGG